MAEVQMLESRVGKLGVPEGAMDRATMYRVAELFFSGLEKQAEEQWEGEGWPPEGLFEVDEVAAANGGKEQRARWELRCRQIRKPELAVIGTSPPMTPPPWAELLEFSYRARLKDLEEEQPAADWRLVGCLIEQIDQSKKTVQRGKPSAGGADLSAVTSSWEWTDDLAAMTRKMGGPSRVIDERNVAMMVHLVFADFSRSELLQHPGDKHGDYQQGSAPMERYAAGRFVKFMPKSIKDERAMAKSVMDRLKPKAPPPAVEPEAAPAPSRRIKP